MLQKKSLAIRHLHELVKIDFAIDRDSTSNIIVASLMRCVVHKSTGFLPLHIGSPESGCFYNGQCLNHRACRFCTGRFMIEKI